MGWWPTVRRPRYQCVRGCFSAADGKVDGTAAFRRLSSALIYAAALPVRQKRVAPGHPGRGAGSGSGPSTLG